MQKQTPISVAILGANGYTGAELIAWLAARSDIQIEYLTSRSLAGQPVWQTFPFVQRFGTKIPTSFVEADLTTIGKHCAAVFVCLPHGEAQAQVAALANTACKIIDLSADFRYQDIALYEKNYGTHHYPELLKDAVYGLPEWNRQAIKQANLIANPGCYPTSVLLPLLPLAQKRWLAGPVIADCQSGVTGAGRTPKIGTMFAEVQENLQAYGLPHHRHESEMICQVKQLAQTDIDIVFTPHLAPVRRGILSTLQLQLVAGQNAASVHQLLQTHYQNEVFVKVYPLGHVPTSAAVIHSNDIHIGVVERRPQQITIVSTLDNLAKGAATQAIQNFNLCMGLQETTGLLST